MELEDMRRAFGLPNLDVAHPAVPGRGNNPAIAAVPAVTVLASRAAIPAIMDEGQQGSAWNFGPMSNALFMQHVFAKDRVFQTFVLWNCNAGLFQKRIDSMNVAKMLQLVSLGRIGVADALPTQTSARVPCYQALALAESLGPFIPDTDRLPQIESRRQIIAATKWLLTDDGQVATQLELDDWYNEEVLGVATAVIEGDAEMNIHQALVLLEGMAIVLPSNNQWLNSLSYVTTALASLCRRGSLTDEHRQKIVEGVKDATSSRSVFINALTAQRFYKLHGHHLTANNAAQFMDHYSGIIPVDIIALRNLILQAAGSGLTTYMTIVRALAAYGDFPWARVARAVPQDMANFDLAITAIGANLYFGFNAQMGVAAAKKFPSLAYVSFELCIKAAGDQPLARYAGRPRVVPAKTLLDELIQRYLDDMLAEQNAAQPPQEMVDRANALRERALLANAAINAAPVEPRAEVVAAPGPIQPRP